MRSKKPYYKDMTHYGKNNDICFYLLGDVSYNICLSGYPNGTKLNILETFALEHFGNTLGKKISKKEIGVIYSKNHNIT